MTKHHHTTHHTNVVAQGSTPVDDSVRQQVHTRGGDFTQDVHAHSTAASGHGAVAVGGDIDDSTVTPGSGDQVGDDNTAGHHNLVGNGNAVVGGDDNTTAFGRGAATSAHIDGAKVSGGGALSIGGPATGSQVTVDSHDHTSTHTTTTSTVSDSGNVHADTEINSHNDTYNDTYNDSHDHFTENLLSHNHVDISADLLAAIDHGIGN